MLRSMRKLAIVFSVAAMAAGQQSGTRDFEKTGGKKGDANHPVEKWVRTLWAVYEESPRTPEGDKAAVQAVHLLIHADRFPEAYERADRVPADDPAWEDMPEILVEAGSLQND